MYQETAKVAKVLTKFLTDSNISFFDLPTLVLEPEYANYYPQVSQLAETVSNHLANLIVDQEIKRFGERLEVRLARGEFDAIVNEYMPDYHWLKTKSEEQVAQSTNSLSRGEA